MRLSKSISCLWIVSALVMTVASFCLAGQAAQESLLLSLGAQAGMQGAEGQRVWTLGVLAQVGPSEGLQIRLGLELGVLGDATLTQLETLVLFNTQLGARVYFGGGVGVAWVANAEDPSRMQFPLLALLGLKTRPMGPWTISVEGMLLAPAQEGLRESLATRFSAGVLFSF